MIKLIASDMDGTLLNNNHDIDVETVESIKNAENMGIIFAISTGRSYNSVRDILDKHNIRCQCILASGAEYRDEDGNILNSINIDNKTAKKVIMTLKENNTASTIATNKGMFSPETMENALTEIAYRRMVFNPEMTKDEALKHAKEDKFFTELNFIDDIDMFFNSDIEIRKIVAFNKDINLINNLKSKISIFKNLAVSSSFYDNIEITNINAQKGICLKQVTDKMGIDKKEVMIVGDSFNDYNMFEVFDETVAMKNAIPEVKSIAKYITDTNNNLGVKKAIDNVINNTMSDMLNKNKI